MSVNGLELLVEGDYVWLIIYNKNIYTYTYIYIFIKIK